ncbi:ABC transporter substrate-binding protein [Cellulomonas hominis]
MKRLTGATAVLTLAVGLLAGCGGSGTEPAASGTPDAVAPPASTPSTPAERTTVRIASLQGPTTMGLVKLMSDAEAGTGAQDYVPTMYGTPDEVVPLVVQGQVDVALIPANLAAVLYAKTSTADGPQVQVAAVTTLGVLQVLEAGDTVHSVADLRGRTVYSTGKGASPEYVLDHLLRANGLDPATDVTVEFRSEATEVAALLASEPGAVGVLPQPYVTVLQTQHPEIRTALDLTDEWTKVTPDSRLVTGVLVVRTAFAAEHPAAVADLLADYRASAEFVNAHPADAAPLVVAAGLAPSAAVAEAAIPASHITDLEGAELRSALGGYLQVLFDTDPASVGGAVPGDDFYLGDQ